MADNEYICPNCGAEINKTDAKCPFCGYINEEGAEKEYMDHLYDIRNELDNVDEEAAAEYGKGYGKVLKIIALTMAVLLVVSGIIYSSASVLKKRTIGSNKNISDDMLEEMTFRRETYKELDRLYEEGDYEKMCDYFFDAYEQNHSIYEWEHYWFLGLYENYLLTVKDLERIDKEGWNEYDAKSIFYRCCTFYYEEVYKTGKYNNKLTDEEEERLRPQIEYMHNVLYERLNFTDEDMVKLKDKLVGNCENIEYDACVKVASERMSQFN